MLERLEREQGLKVGVVNLTMFRPFPTDLVSQLLKGKKGVTVRGAIDCIIAQTCLDLDAELLSPDVDFERIAGHTSLRLCSAMVK